MALIRQGPDELFGGYRRHVGVRYGAYWGSLPKWVRGTVSSELASDQGMKHLNKGFTS